MAADGDEAADDVGELTATDVARRGLWMLGFRGWAGIPLCYEPAIRLDHD